MTDQLLWESADDIGCVTFNRFAQRSALTWAMQHIDSVLIKRPPAWTGT